MMTSVDGRIDCPMVAQISGNEYYDALNALGTASKLSGRVTASIECSAVAETALKEDSPIGKETVWRSTEAGEYTIVVDTRGSLQWQRAEADGCPILCILSQLAGKRHLKALQNTGISYIVTGREHIDLKRAVEILARDFAVKRLIIVGGGHINGGFLQAGLIDEVSLMIGAGIDGRKGETAVFDGITDTQRRPTPLRLKSVEQCPGTDTLWIRYTRQ